jgi:hypothetical protein
MSRASRDLDREMAKLDAELAVRRLEGNLMLLEIRAEQNRQLWYLAGILIGVTLRVWAEKRCGR